MKADTVIGLIGTAVSIGVFAFAFAGATGCSGSYGNFSDGHTFGSQDFVMGGNKEGIDAYHKGLIGALKTMVEPKEKSLYMDSRDAEDHHITIRNEDGKTFWQRLSARARKSVQAEAMGGK